MGGRKSVTRSGQPLGYDPTAVETGLAALGIRSTREQEASEFRHEYYTRQKRYNEQKNQLLHSYAIADSQAERGRIMRYVTENVNPSLPEGLKITIPQLVAAASNYRRRAEMSPELMGLPINRRTRALMPAPDVYNV